jgi:hypothetical protein
VTCSRITRAVLLNVRDQYINNFDTAKHARLTCLTRTRTSNTCTRVARATRLTRLLTSSIFINIIKTVTSGPQVPRHMDGSADETPHDTIEEKKQS